MIAAQRGIQINLKQYFPGVRYHHPLLVSIMYYNNRMLRKQEVLKRQQKLEESGLYQCYICMKRLINPIQCLSCTKMLCATHTDKIKNRCPFCRAHPFKYSRDQNLASFLSEVSREEWETLGKQAIHQCKITNCEFQGTYVAMLKHRKKSHGGLSIEDVMTGEFISDEARKMAMMRSMIKKLIEYKVMELSLTAVQNQLQPDDVSERKKHPNLEEAKRLAEHVATCMSEECRKLWNTKWGSYVGRAGEEQEGVFYLSGCERGKVLNCQLGWKYHDPRH